MNEFRAEFEWNRHSWLRARVYPPAQTVARFEDSSGLIVLSQFRCRGESRRACTDDDRFEVQASSCVVDDLIQVVRQRFRLRPCMDVSDNSESALRALLPHTSERIVFHAGLCVKLSAQLRALDFLSAKIDR